MVMTMDANPQTYTLQPPVAKFAPVNQPRVHVDLGQLLARVDVLEKQNESIRADVKAWAQAVSQVILAQNQAVAKLNGQVASLELDIAALDANFVEYTRSRDAAAREADKKVNEDIEEALEESEPTVSSAGPLEHVARLRKHHGPPQRDDRDLTPKSGYGADMEDSEE